MKYKVGDKVRIKSIDWYNENKDEYGNIDISHDFTFYADRSKYCGKVFTISKVFDNSYLVKEDNNEYYWTDEMIEGLVEEEVDLIPKFGEYSDNDPLDIPTMTTEFVKEHGLPCPNDYIFKDENGNVINATKIVLEKKKKEYDKGTKVRHKTKGMVETVIGLCKIKYMGAWVDGVIYEGNDVHTGEPMTFVRVKEDFENNFEVWQH